MKAVDTILLVDDELDVRKEIARVLTEWGYAVDEADDVKDTMNKLSKNDYELVLLDLRIPDMDDEIWGVQGGLQTLKTIRNTKPMLPVIVFSMLADEVDHIVFPIKMGAYDFFRKDELLGQNGGVEGRGRPV